MTHQNPVVKYFLIFFFKLKNVNYFTLCRGHELHAMRGAGAACGILAVLITVTLTYAATHPGDAAAHGLLAGPASVFRASRPSGYPPSWATR